MHQWLRDNIVCPRHRKALTLERDQPYCPEGDTYIVVDGIPALMFDNGDPTHGFIRQTLSQAERIKSGEPIENVLQTESRSNEDIDGFVKENLPYTCGFLYFALQDTIKRYPFQEAKLIDGNGKRLLDIGCGWGRWSIPAQKNGYQVGGADPNLDSLLAARRVAQQAGSIPSFVACDALSLPFRDSSFDVAFSYSIFQHFKKNNVKKALREASRTTKINGETLIQMPNKFGLRSFYHQLRLGFKDGKEGSDVFYWSPSELVREFERAIGRSEVSVDCYFGLNPQKNDIDIMPPLHRFYIRTSEFFKSMSRTVKPLVKVADSLFVTSLNQKTYVSESGER